MQTLLENIGSIYGSLPLFVSSILTLVAGWLAATLLRLIVSKGLALARFDKASEKAGFSEFLRKGNVTYSPSKFVGSAVFWVALLGTLLVLARKLDMDVFTALWRGLGGIVENGLAALFVAVVGALIVSFISNFVYTIARNAAWPHAQSLSRLIKYSGYILIATIALEQAGLGKSIISLIVQLFVGAAAFGAALAFGLGCKDMARDAMQGFINNIREKNRAHQQGDMEG